MPRFEYRALRPTGTEIAGELIAADERDAAARLQAGGSYPIEITQPSGHRFARHGLGRHGLGRHGLGRHLAAGGRRLAPRELILFTRQLAALIGAGVALDRALGLIGAARGREAGRRLAVELLAAVTRGESLSFACRSHPGLPPHYPMMIAAGEARGDLGAALERLAQVLERSRATSRALIDALIYPASVLVVAVVSIAFLLGFVVPRFEVLLTSVAHEPPLAMRVLLALSTAFQTLALPGAVVVLGLIGLFAVRYRDAGFRLAVHKRLLGVPGLGPLIGKIETERMFYFLGNLVSAGVDLPAALAATRAAMTSEAFRAGLLLTEQGIERGDGIAAAFAASLVLPEVAGELVHIGEETGDLAAMLLKAGDILRRESEATSVELIAIVTPISIVLLGLLIGAVAAAILGTVMEVYDFAL
jgi:general secretion pathway protein F